MRKQWLRYIHKMMSSLSHADVNPPEVKKTSKQAREDVPKVVKCCYFPIIMKNCYRCRTMDRVKEERGFHVPIRNFVCTTSCGAATCLSSILKQ